MKRPDWIRRKLSFTREYFKVKKLLGGRGLNSVCTGAACPNRCECWGKGHVTFMILGGNCTRSCLFCNLRGGIPSPVDGEEPANIARAVKELALGYAVITSVTRDDLEDLGARQFVETVREIKRTSPATSVELLIPDMRGERALVEKIALSGADVIGHNIEVPRDLYPLLRREADYDRSLAVLARLARLARSPQEAVVKSSIITGLGESTLDIITTMRDLKNAGVQVLYIGQYLSPSKKHWPVKKFYTPGEFDEFKAEGERMGFDCVFSGPLVRSSYRAAEAYRICKANKTVKV
jgi:lipoic acid synthetase